MTRLPIVSFKTMERVLLRLGFEMVRQSSASIPLEEVLQEVGAMKVNYDKKHDIAYIRLSSKRPDGAIEITEGVMIDTTAKDEIVGIEIFNASRRFPLKNLFSVELLRV